LQLSIVFGAHSLHLRLKRHRPALLREQLHRVFFNFGCFHCCVGELAHVKSTQNRWRNQVRARRHGRSEHAVHIEDYR
jgi:hypothetical protein